MATDRSTVARTYQLRPETIRRIKALVETLQVYDSSVADVLLRYGLDAVDAGRLTLARRPVAWVIERGDGQG